MRQLEIIILDVLISVFCMNQAIRQSSSRVLPVSQLENGLYQEKDDDIERFCFSLACRAVSMIHSCFTAASTF